MWSSSDNKKKEDLDDCSCSSSKTGTGYSGSVAAVTEASATHPKQHSLVNTTAATTTGSNIYVENNSNIGAKPFGGNDLNTTNKLGQKQEQQQQHQQFSEKELKGDETTLETVDSGFISGPQTNSFASESEDDEAASSFKGEQEISVPTKIVNKQLLNIAHEEEAEEIPVTDSGCIEEEFDDEEYEKEEFKQQQQQQQVHAAEKSNSSHFSDNSPVATTAAVATAAVENQMHLKQNVDAGMVEWFCNLSLQNTPTTAQQQQSAVAGTTMNNLGGAVRKTAPNASATNTITNSSKQQAAGNSATTNSTNLTPLNAWEQFYQQNDDGDTPLHLACISGYVDVVAALIRMAPHPCLFNIQNDEAQTPLHLAVLTAQPKILRMLLIAGAEPTIRDRHGNTALHLACISGEEQCVCALTIPISASEINEAHRQYGHRSNDKTFSYLSYARLPSDLEIRNYDGERCVHLAAQAGHINVLRSLVFHGADINAREGKSGRTPLHIAIEGCNEDLTNFLLDECYKLNLEAATYAGLTAYQVACILNKSQMQNILEKRGAEPLTPPDSDYDSDIESDLEDSKLYDHFGDPGYFISYNGGNFMAVA